MRKLPTHIPPKHLDRVGGRGPGTRRYFWPCPEIAGPRRTRSVRAASGRRPSGTLKPEKKLISLEACAFDLGDVPSKLHIPFVLAKPGCRVGMPGGEWERLSPGRVPPCPCLVLSRWSSTTRHIAGIRAFALGAALGKVMTESPSQRPHLCSWLRRCNECRPASPQHVVSSKSCQGAHRMNIV